MNTSFSRLRFESALCVFFIVEGIWELFSPVVFGVFTANKAHGIVHLLLGIVGLVAGAKGAAGKFLGFVGALLVAVGVCWFLPATRHLPEQLFNVNRAVAVFNLIVGALALVLAAGAGRRATHA